METLPSLISGRPGDFIETASSSTSRQAGKLIETSSSSTSKRPGDIKETSSSLISGRPGVFVVSPSSLISKRPGDLVVSPSSSTSGGSGNVIETSSSSSPGQPGEFIVSPSSSSSGGSGNAIETSPSEEIAGVKRKRYQEPYDPIIRLLSIVLHAYGMSSVAMRQGLNLPESTLRGWLKRPSQILRKALLKANRKALQEEKAPAKPKCEMLLSEITPRVEFNIILDRADLIFSQTSTYLDEPQPKTGNKDVKNDIAETKYFLTELAVKAPKLHLPKPENREQAFNYGKKCVDWFVNCPSLMKKSGEKIERLKQLIGELEKRPSV